ncbi:patatin-like phospholipase family protein [Pseudofrankia sp. DC12]|uniref:patatin-like phospholipase family protein n=1 Tax=Pseudofrankia sp. DC12 TaxID=683315 RepID=UPI0005F8045E|nr:patatin-like phospholipase family protein [Pseudofrankia sp. DC12]
MTRKQTPARRRTPRRGLVLGAGGILGSAWMIGALRAYQERTGDDVRSFDLIVGTSAGSVVSALLSVGVEIDTMADSERGQYAPGAPVLDYRELGPSLPPPPRMRMGSPRLLTAGMLHPHRLTPMVALAALLPQGRGTLAAVGDLVGQAASARPVGPDLWPARLRIVAMDFDSGRRVLFGAHDAPTAPLAQAVMASCAIPGWYAPVLVDGRRFVDGGTRSPTSLDLCVDAGLDEILVLAPACAFDYDHPHRPVAVVERQLRRAATRRLAAEIALAEATGARVRVLCPGHADLVAMGGNVMDLARRTAVFETSLRTSAAALADLPGWARQPARPTAPTATRTTAPTLPRTPRPVAGTGRTAPQTRTRPVPTSPTTIPASPVTGPSGVSPARGPVVREEPDLAG